MKAYARFGGMIITSTVVMYGLLYLNILRFEDVFLVRRESMNPDFRLRAARNAQGLETKDLLIE